MAVPLWKMQLVPASFRGAEFKIEVNSRASGRRVVLHEFPKRDQPYAEDMGRAARRFPVTGYVIGSDYKAQRDALIAALEAEGPGLLILPTLGEQIVQPREYAVREQRQAGGMAEFEMTFVEAGAAAFDTNESSSSASNTAADNAQNQAVASSGKDLAGSGGGGGQMLVT